MKKYLCTWDNKDLNAVNSYEFQQKKVEESYFNTDNGYESEDIEKILNLEVSKSYTATYGNHTIKRIN